MVWDFCGLLLWMLGKSKGARELWEGGQHRRLTYSDS